MCIRCHLLLALDLLDRDRDCIQLMCYTCTASPRVHLRGQHRYRHRHRNQTQNLKGPLAPFNEELTFNFRGPLNLYNIAVYQPDSSGATWTQTSSWAAGQAPNNLVFMNNMGGGASGEWSSASWSFAGFDLVRGVLTDC